MPKTTFVALALATMLACAACAGIPGVDPAAAMPPLGVTAWLPASQPKAVIVAVHGRNADRSAFALPATVWARRGILTYAYDHPPLMTVRGRLGIAALTESFTAIIAQVHDRHSDLPLYVVGDSMGGDIVILALARSPAIPIAGIVLSAPPIWPDDASASTATGLLTAMADVFDSDMLHSWAALVTLMEAAPEQAIALADRRVLVLYGEDDRLIPPGGVYRLMALLGSSAQLRTFSDAGHRVIRTPAASDVVADWIAAASPTVSWALAD